MDKREFRGSFERDSLKFLIDLDKRFQWFSSKPRGHWIFYKKRLLKILEEYEDKLLDDYLYRLGRIAEAYKHTYDIEPLRDLKWKEGIITNDDFLKEIDRLKEVIWGVIEWKNPDIYKNVET